MEPRLKWSRIRSFTPEPVLENNLFPGPEGRLLSGGGEKCSRTCSMDLSEDHAPFGAADRLLTPSERELMIQIKQRSQYCKCFVTPGETWRAHCCGCRSWAAKQTCCLPWALTKMAQAQSLSLDRWWTPPCCRPPPREQPKPCPPLPPVGSCPEPPPPCCPPKPKPCPPKPCPPKPEACPPKPCPPPPPRCPEKKPKCCPPCVKPCPDEDRPKPKCELCPFPRPFPPEIPEDRAPCSDCPPKKEACPPPKPKPCPPKPPETPKCPEKPKPCPEKPKPCPPKPPSPPSCPEKKPECPEKETERERRRKEKVKKPCVLKLEQILEQKDAVPTKTQREDKVEKNDSEASPVKKSDSDSKLAPAKESKRGMGMAPRRKSKMASKLLRKKSQFSAIEDEEEYSDCEATRRILNDKLKEISFDVDRLPQSNDDIIAEISRLPKRCLEDEDFSDAGEPLCMNYDQSSCCRYCGKFYPETRAVIARKDSPVASGATSSCSSVASLVSECSMGNERRNNVHLSLLMDGAQGSGGIVKGKRDLGGENQNAYVRRRDEGGAVNVCDCGPVAKRRRVDDAPNRLWPSDPLNSDEQHAVQSGDPVPHLYDHRQGPSTRNLSEMHVNPSSPAPLDQQTISMKVIVNRNQCQKSTQNPDVMVSLVLPRLSALGSRK